MLWERTFGGTRKDDCRGMHLTEQGLLVVAYSNSNANHGQAQIIYLNDSGDTINEFLFGEQPTVPAGIAQTAAGHFVVTGSVGTTDGDETDYWALAFDKEGRILHEERLDLGKQDQATRMAVMSDGQLVVSGFSIGKNTLQEDYTLVSFSPTAKLHWKKQLQANADDRLQQVVATRDKGLLLAGTSNSMAAYDKTVATQGHSDYWILKTSNVKRYVGEDGFAQEQTGEEPFTDDTRRIDAFPVPAKRFVTVVVPFDFLTATLSVHDLSGRLVHHQPMNSRTAVLDMNPWPQGIFLLQVVADEHTMERKIVKYE